MFHVKHLPFVSIFPPHRLPTSRDSAPGFSLDQALFARGLPCHLHDAPQGDVKKFSSPFFVKFRCSWRYCQILVLRKGSFFFFSVTAVGFPPFPSWLQLIIITARSWAMQEPYPEPRPRNSRTSSRKMRINKLNFGEKSRNLKKMKDRKCDIFFPQNSYFPKAFEFVSDSCSPKIPLLAHTLCLWVTLHAYFQRLIRCQYAC